MQLQGKRYKNPSCLPDGKVVLTVPGYQRYPPDFILEDPHFFGQEQYSQHPCFSFLSF